MGIMSGAANDRWRASEAECDKLRVKVAALEAENKYLNAELNVVKIERQLAKAKEDAARIEVERLNKMRTHCERCGADYMDTGLAQCPCLLKAEVERLRGLCGRAGDDLDALMFEPGGRVCVRDVDFWSETDKRILERTVFSLKEAAQREGGE